MDAQDEVETAPLSSMQPPQPHGRWYSAKRVQLLAIAGLCALLVIILVGPGPRMATELPAEVDAAAGVRGAAHEQQAAGAVGKPRPVAVDFYGESLCPDCQHMVRDVLGEMFSNGIADAMTLRYVAFGNVRNNSDGSWAYQHGPDEGLYNRHILCAQHSHAAQTEWFPYVRCLAEHMDALRQQADGCATERGWSAADIAACANGDKGKELEVAAAQETWALSPKKSFVPWMVVNGVAIGNDFDRLRLYVCAAAAAEGRPAECGVLPDKWAHQ